MSVGIAKGVGSDTYPHVPLTSSQNDTGLQEYREAPVHEIISSNGNMESNVSSLSSGSQDLFKLIDSFDQSLPSMGFDAVCPPDDPCPSGSQAFSDVGCKADLGRLNAIPLKDQQCPKVQGNTVTVPSQLPTKSNHFCIAFKQGYFLCVCDEVNDCVMESWSEKEPTGNTLGLFQEVKAQISTNKPLGCRDNLKHENTPIIISTKGTKNVWSKSVCSPKGVQKDIVSFENHKMIMPRKEPVVSRSLPIKKAMKSSMRMVPSSYDPCPTTSMQSRPKTPVSLNVPLSHCSSLGNVRKLNEDHEKVVTRSQTGNNSKFADEKTLIKLGDVAESKNKSKKINITSNICLRLGNIRKQAEHNYPRSVTDQEYPPVGIDPIRNLITTGTSECNTNVPGHAGIDGTPVQKQKINNKITVAGSQQKFKVLCSWNSAKIPEEFLKKGAESRKYCGTKRMCHEASLSKSVEVERNEKSVETLAIVQGDSEIGKRSCLDEGISMRSSPKKLKTID